MELLVAHLVGDYLLQPDWMGNQKKYKSFPCLVHCLIYTGIIWAFTLWPMWALGLVFFTHFLIDRTLLVAWYIKKARSHRFMAKPLFPWAYIVVDNTFHLLLLWATALAVKHQIFIEEYLSPYVQQGKEVLKGLINSYL